MCLEPIITAQHSDRLCGLDKCRGQKNQHIDLELDLKQIIHVLDHLVSYPRQHLHVEAHIKFSLEPLLLQDFQTFFHILNQRVVNCQIVAGFDCSDILR